jgi:hypothetical protein
MTHDAVMARYRLKRRQDSIATPSQAGRRLTSEVPATTSDTFDA